MIKTLLFKSIIISIFVLAAGTFASAQNEPEPQPENRRLQIARVPEPAYTPQARINGVTGWIKLRLTFLDTGEIGDIYYVSESDAGRALSRAGLLKTSYEAAKKVQFLPEIKDGKAVTVTKVLMYNFAMGDRPVFRTGRRP